jgi:hypothetical protein
MAPVLQCPDCGTKHSLNEVPEAGEFACQGCGRVLKVPDPAGQRTQGQSAAPPTQAVAAATPAPPPGAPATTVLPVVATNSASSAGEPERRPSAASGWTRPAALGDVPWWMRLLLWIVAIPIGFFLVFFVARALGFFTSSQLSDVFLASSTSRFWPVVRLLPFVALVIALLVQGGVYAIARLRDRRTSTGPTRVDSQLR